MLQIYPCASSPDFLLSKIPILLFSPPWFPSQAWSNHQSISYNSRVHVSLSSGCFSLHTVDDQSFDHWENFPSLLFFRVIPRGAARQQQSFYNFSLYIKPTHTWNKLAFFLHLLADFKEPHDCKLNERLWHKNFRWYVDMDHLLMPDHRFATIMDYHLLSAQYSALVARSPCVTR